MKYIAWIILGIMFLFFASIPFWITFYNYNRTCESEMEGIKIDRSCNLIVQELPNRTGVITYKLKGYDYINQQETTYVNDDRVCQPLFAKFTEIGDTFIKKQGSTTYILAKKNYRLLYEWRCVNKSSYRYHYIDSTRSLDHIPDSIPPDRETRTDY